MTILVEYFGPDDVRSIRDTDFTAAGFSEQETVTWSQDNGFEVELPDDVAAWVLAQGSFRVPGKESFAESLEYILDSRIAETLPELATSLGVVVDDTAPGLARFFPRVVSGTGTGVSNSTTETTVITATMSSLAVGDSLLGRLAALVTNNTGSDQTITFRLKVRGVTVCTVAPSIPSNGTVYHMVSSFEGLFMNIGITIFLGSMVMDLALANNTATGLGPWPRILSPSLLTLGNDVPIEVTAQPGAASSNLKVENSQMTLRLGRISL